MRPLRPATRARIPEVMLENRMELPEVVAEAHRLRDVFRAERLRELSRAAGDFAQVVIKTMTNTQEIP